VQADAGKTRGTIKCLLVEHAQIRQNARALGKLARLAMASSRARHSVGFVSFSGFFGHRRSKYE
jgi:hypothetical protein